MRAGHLCPSCTKQTAAQLLSQLQAGNSQEAHQSEVCQAASKLMLMWVVTSNTDGILLSLPTSKRPLASSATAAAAEEKPPLSLN
jgi:hypothetical protein